MPSLNDGAERPADTSHGCRFSARRDGLESGIQSEGNRTLLGNKTPKPIISTPQPQPGWLGGDSANSN